jgi:ParB-like chromosome segregation protein Spo0J
MNRDSADRMIASVPVAKIRVGERSRALREEAVASLVESIKSIGLQTPISVQIDESSRDERYLLVAGLHRLEACRRLGVAHIDARIVDLDETERRLWEISENLHRAELTVTERSEHIAEWIKLTEERDRVSAQVEPKLSVRGRAGEGRPEAGVRAAARELGVDRNEAQRAVKIAGLTSEAKDEARALGLDDNQRALLGAARAPTKEAQIRALREEAAHKAARHDDAGASERRLEAAMTAVKRLSQDEFATFADWFGAFRMERANSADGADAKTSTGWTMRI